MSSRGLTAVDCRRLTLTVVKYLRPLRTRTSSSDWTSRFRKEKKKERGYLGKKVEGTTQKHTRQMKMRRKTEGSLISSLSLLCFDPSVRGTPQWANLCSHFDFLSSHCTSHFLQETEGCFSFSFSICRGLFSFFIYSQVGLSSLRSFQESGRC